jgi:glycosyltransferase involved in cell wall biosynthesis
LEFHNRVRIALSRSNVHYRLLYSGNALTEQAKADEAVPEWAEKIPVRYFGRSEHAILYQSVWSPVRGADLVIIGQHSKHLHTYLLIFCRWLRLSPRLAFFGHGRGYQATKPDGLAERFKRFWASRVDWWFAYTQSGADAVAASGFARDRITVFNNAIDTSAIRRALAEIDEPEREELRWRLLGGSHNVGVYIGGIYRQKRIEFLIAAAVRIRSLVPDFQLLVIGGGEDAGLVNAAAAEHSWIHALGPKFGREKTLLASLGRVFLMPGLVGLAVLDAFAYGTPMVTTALPYHSPEIGYLRNGENGIIVSDPDDVDAYAVAVAEVLRDDALRERLNRAAAMDAQFYTIENMADRFAAGILKALEV